MSVTSDDAAGRVAPGDSITGPAVESAKLSHLLIDEPSHSLFDQTNPWPADAVLGADHYEAATIALNVSDVVDLGTESIAGLEALVITGQSGDVVQLANETGYAWVRAENGDIPEGYDIYHARVLGAADGNESSPSVEADHGQPVYVLVQQDLTVILETA
ncbi:MAG TPA: hypothetical protein VF920_04105 [Dongiaceae bacterium]